MLDVFDCGNPNTVAQRKIYYKSLGFLPLPDQSLRLLILIQKVQSLSDR